MTTNDYMRLAAQAAEMREQLRPSAEEPFAGLINLAAYHLFTAASKLRMLGEAQAERDRTAAAEPKVEA